MRSWLLPFALAALLAAGVVWFLSTHERVPSREWVGPSAEARRGMYLAAGRFATRMGLPTRELRSLLAQSFDLDSDDIKILHWARLH